MFLFPAMSMRAASGKSRPTRAEFRTRTHLRLGMAEEGHSLLGQRECT
jgi:hypothetical protein